jgi:hypothetical protein
VVFIDLAVCFAEAEDKAALIAHGKIGVDEVDVELEGLGGVARRLLQDGSVAGGRRSVRGRRLLGTESRCGDEQKREQESGRAAHKDQTHRYY